MKTIISIIFVLLFAGGAFSTTIEDWIFDKDDGEFFKRTTTVDETPITRSDLLQERSEAWDEIVAWRALKAKGLTQKEAEEVSRLVGTRRNLTRPVYLDRLNDQIDRAIFKRDKIQEAIDAFDAAD